MCGTLFFEFLRIFLFACVLILPGLDIVILLGLIGFLFTKKITYDAIHINKQTITHNVQILILAHPIDATYSAY